MFGRSRIDECTRVRERLSLYLDDQLESVERDSVRFHAEKCRECQYELETLKMTRELLHRMPAATIPRSFTLTEAPSRRSWFSFEMPVISLENSLRMATAAAVIIFALLITLDLSGVVSEQSSKADGVTGEGITSDIESVAVNPVPSATPTVEPAIISTDIRDHEATQPDGPEWDTNPVIGAQDNPEIQEDTSGNNIPEQAGNLNPNGERGVVSPPPLSTTPSWLFPMEIAVGVLIFLFGCTSLLVLRKRRAVRS